MYLEYRDIKACDQTPVPSPVNSYSPPTQQLSGLYAGRWKRRFDVVAVLLAAPIWVPLTVLVCLLAMLDGHAPIFKQRRLGRGGKIFMLYKVRTMVPDAESHLETMIAKGGEAADEWHTKQKLDADPRITTVGRVLRAISADELPQMWNVLRGDMSLVGPRPILPCQTDRYHGIAYYSVRPGITGIWQTAVRNDSDFSARASYDEKYVSELSFGLDLKLLLRTVWVVLCATGR